MYKIVLTTIDNKNVGKINQDTIPRKGEMIIVDKHRYCVEQVLWSYRSPGKDYLDDPLSFYGVSIVVNQIV